MMKTKAMLAAALAAALAGCTVSQDAPREVRKMRVLTYNILYSGDSDNKPPKWDRRRAWAHRRDDLAAFVRRIDPDLGGFQEACADQVEFMKEKMPEYGFSGEYRGRENGVPLSGAPVFWRKDRFEAGKCGTFWLSPTPDVPGSFGWGSHGPRTCCWQILTDRAGGRKFLFANMHADHRSDESKLKSAEVVVERLGRIADGLPVVLIGDHNVHQTDAPAMLFAKTWKNALYESETPPKGAWRSYNGWTMKKHEPPVADALKVPVAERVRDKRKYGGRPDYIFVTPGTRVLSYETNPEMRPGLDLYYSDHFPVFADLVL